MTGLAVLTQTDTANRLTRRSADPAMRGRATALRGALRSAAARLRTLRPPLRPMASWRVGSTALIHANRLLAANAPRAVDRAVPPRGGVRRRAPTSSLYVSPALQRP